VTSPGPNFYTFEYNLRRIVALLLMLRFISVSQNKGYICIGMIAEIFDPPRKLEIYTEKKMMMKRAPGNHGKPLEEYCELHSQLVRVVIRY